MSTHGSSRSGESQDLRESSTDVAVVSDDGSSDEASSSIGHDIPLPLLEAHMARLSQRSAHSDAATGFEEEFLLLEQKSDTNYYGDFHESLKHVNRPKNRYSNVLPLDRTRVTLTPVDDMEGSDYINANWVDGFEEHAYVAAQGPLKETTPDFWRMIWETSANVVAMLTKLVENDRVKCYQYWPGRKKPRSFGAFKVTMTGKTKGAEVVERILEVENKASGEKRVIHHYQYKEWPDHGLPASASAFRTMLAKVESVRNPKAPVIVHCSAGIGRSGTFCTVDTITKQIEDRLSKEPDQCPSVNIFKTILGMRTNRVGMVQTKEQYIFCYQAVAEAWTARVRESPNLQAASKHILDAAHESPTTDDDGATSVETGSDTGVVLMDDGEDGDVVTDPSGGSSDAVTPCERSKQDPC